MLEAIFRNIYIFQITNFPFLKTEFLKLCRCEETMQILFNEFLGLIKVS